MSEPSPSASETTSKHHPSNPPETNQLCAIELASGETQANIDASFKWAATYSEPYLQCRADIVRRSTLAYYACIANNGEHCADAGVQWFYDNGYPLHNLIVTHIVSGFVRKCADCDHTSVTLGDLTEVEGRWNTDGKLEFEGPLFVPQAKASVREWCEGCAQ